MATAITPLANITLSSSASTVTFSSISGSYRDLYLVIAARTTTANTHEPIQLRFNGDTGSNYPRVMMWGTGSTTGSYQDTNPYLIFDMGATGANSAANSFGNTTISILDYAQTDKHKSVLARANVETDQVRAYAGRWASTSAVTTLLVTTYYGTNFAAGSTFALYGVSA